MTEATSKSESIARALCERQMRSWGTPEKHIGKAVDRYWHCVAAEIEAGIVDESGNRLRPFNFDEGVEAWRDWRRRQRQR